MSTQAAEHQATTKTILIVGTYDTISDNVVELIIGFMNTTWGDITALTIESTPS